MSANSKNILETFASRRTIYALSGESTIPDSRIEEIIRETLLVTPSAFNTQSTRIVALLGDNHKKIWDIVRAAVAPFVSGEQATATEAKIANFQRAYGTILFFEDPTPFDALQSFKLYVDKFDSWRQETSGMHQLLVWTLLEAEGLGGNLQHYNPLIDDEVKKTFSIDTAWKLNAQLVIGKPEGERPAAKAKKPVEERYRILA